MEIVYPVKLLRCPPMENYFAQIEGKNFLWPRNGRHRIIGLGFSDKGYPGNYALYVRFGELEIAPGSS
jgi:hypothetical protein